MNHKLSSLPVSAQGEMGYQQAFVEAVINVAGHVIAVIDITGTVVRFNRTAEELTGWSRDAVIGQPVWTYLIPPEQVEGVKGVFNRLLQGQVSLAGRYENEWLCHDGRRILFDWHNTVLQDANGKVSHIVALGYDVTSQRRTEQRLMLEREQQKALRELQEVILNANSDRRATLMRFLDVLFSISWLQMMPRGGIFVVEGEPPSLRLYANYQMEREANQYCAEVAFGNCICGMAWATSQTIFVPVVDERHTIRFSDMDDHGHIALPIMHGETVLGVLLIYTLPGQQKDVAQEEFLLAASEILASYMLHWKQEDELESYRLHLEWLVEERARELNAANFHLQQTMLALDRGKIAVHWVDVTSGRFLYVNDYAAAMLGYSRDEMLKMGVQQIDPEWNHETFAANAPRLRRDKTAHFETVNLHRDGRQIPVDITLYYNENEANGIFIAFLSDISQRKEIESALIAARRQAEEANAAKGRFLANMSHEIRTPMNAIIGMAHLLTRTGLNLRQADYVNKITLAGQHLLGVINDILDLAKIDADCLTIVPRDFLLHELIQQKLTMLELLAAERGVVLRLEMAGDLPSRLHGDEDRIGQIVINLVANAIKFSPRQAGRVELRFSAVTETEQRIWLRCEVEDNGIGISKQQLEQLFQPFHQADTTTSRNYGGTGLGLVICKRLAELMGGQIGVTSRLGQGSRFWFEIPLLVRDEVSSEVAPKLHLPGLIGKRVLIVEDNPYNQQVARELLEERGIWVDVAENGIQAVEILRRTTMDLVLMDVQMPLMDGFEATRVIRQELKQLDLPIIAMSANVAHEDQARCLAAGMNAHLGKPFQPQALFAMVGQWLLSQPATGYQEPPRVVAQEEPLALESFSPEILTAQIGDDPQRIVYYLQLFLASFTTTMGEMRDAEGRGERREIAHLAHRLKSSARAVGALRLAEICQQLERMAQDVVPWQLITQLDHEGARVTAAINHMLPTPGDNTV
jgi:PAS domain S-box-containing protein